MNAEGGFSMVEMLVVVALLGLATAIAVPNIAEMRRKIDLERLARQVAGDAMRCRMEALTSCRNVGLIFAEAGGRPYYIMVADGNGKGVSREDFLKHVDRALGPRVWLDFLSAGTRIGIPRDWDVPDPSGDGLLEGEGLKVGRSGIISFSPYGHATPSSVYFNDGRGSMMVIRVNGGLGRVRAMLWRKGWSRWHEVKL